MASRASRLRPPAAALGAGAILAASLAGSLAFWPGLMIWDSARQYAQAVSGAFDDWHPPVMEAIWRLLLPLSQGPWPMLVLQLALWTAGFALIIAWAVRRATGGRAIAIIACTLLPLSMALMGEVIKDSLMTAALVLATGLWLGAEGRAAGRRIAAAALILFAASVRYNAFLAGLPMLVALAPVAWRDRPIRLVSLAAAALVALMSVMPLANALLGARKSGVELSLVIFDLGGIGYHSGADAFPPLGLRDPVGANRACYTPRRWDSYAEWSDAQCPIHFDTVRAAFARRRLSPRWWEMQAILAHPAAWAEHRLVHWNLETAFLVRRQPFDPVVPPKSDPNDADSQIADTPATRWLVRAAELSALTPLGWPCCWLALGFGLTLVAPALPSRDRILPLSLSGLLYGLGYAVFGVATDERYYFWTMVATCVAAAIAVTDCVDWRTVGRARLAVAGAPLLAITLAAIAWRLV
ncbi:MAG TPA: hypothetical protein VG248_08145 [Caulobacteraceae bacterium]|nr:hypothetical protein [Caulobacteraceae bacterium]